MKNLVIVSFPAKSDTLEKLMDAMMIALPDTRTYDGCLSVDVFIEKSTNTMHLVEYWETLDQQASYLNWRIEDGLLNDLDPLIEGGSSAIKIVICGEKIADI